MSKHQFTGLPRKKSFPTQKVRPAVEKNVEPREMRKYIIQEWDRNLFPGWRDLDGTVRYTWEDAMEVLQKFKAGEMWIGYGTGIYQIHEYWEEDIRP